MFVMPIIVFLFSVSVTTYQNNVPLNNPAEVKAAIVRAVEQSEPIYKLNQ